MTRTGHITLTVADRCLATSAVAAYALVMSPQRLDFDAVRNVAPRTANINTQLHREAGDETPVACYQSLTCRKAQPCYPGPRKKLRGNQFGHDNNRDRANVAGTAHGASFRQRRDMHRAFARTSRLHQNRTTLPEQSRSLTDNTHGGIRVIYPDFDCGYEALTTQGPGASTHRSAGRLVVHPPMQDTTGYGACGWRGRRAMIHA